jgi:hypothetical protein
VSLLLLIISSAFSQTVYTSTGSGNWSTSFSSSGSGSPITYKILSGHTIDVDVNSTTPIDSVIIAGTLSFNNGKKIDLTASGIVQILLGGNANGGNGGSKFRFVGGTDIPGPFSTSGESFATGSSGGTFTTGLPVHWLNVEILQNSNNTTLVWSTATEINNSYFEVESSIDGNIWNTLTSKESKAQNGNSRSILHYGVDISSASNNNFIRIRQVDFDGTSDYSKILKIRKQTTGISISNLTNSKIRITNTADEITSVVITTIDGQEIMSEEISSFIDIRLAPNQIYIISSQSGFVQKIRH